MKYRVFAEVMAYIELGIVEADYSTDAVAIAQESREWCDRANDLKQVRGCYFETGNIEFRAERA